MAGQAPRDPHDAVGIARDTVEEKIRILQHQKTQLVTNVLGDEGFASNLDLNDLQFILTHSIDEEEFKD